MPRSRPPSCWRCWAPVAVSWPSPGGGAGRGPDEAAVSAAELRAVLAAGGDQLPERRDAQWRWPLPPAASETVETVSAAELTRLAAAAAGTLREVSAGGLAGRAVG